MLLLVVEVAGVEVDLQGAEVRLLFICYKSLDLYNSAQLFCDHIAKYIIITRTKYCFYTVHMQLLVKLCSVAISDVQK